MPLIEGVKYACAACIKGHRSSSCQHADRPIFEIKRKGRPPSQCLKCRESRKSNGAHGKCTCKQDKVTAATEDPKLDGPNFKALRAIHRATIQKAYMCQCMSGGSCLCGQQGCSSTAASTSEKSSGCCASKKRPLEPESATPSLDSSFASSASSSLWPATPFSPFNPSHSDFIGALPQPSVPLPAGCNTGIWPSQNDQKEPLPLLFNDWIFGDVMMPENLFPLAPLPSTILEGACSSCGSPGCKCGASCECPSVQALQQSLLFDSPSFSTGPTSTPLSTIDQAFIDSVLGPTPPTSSVLEWQRSISSMPPTFAAPPLEPTFATPPLAPQLPDLSCLPFLGTSFYAPPMPALPVLEEAPPLKSCCARKLAQQCQL